MSFDYFSKSRMTYILEKLKTIFDTKADTSDVPQDLSDLSDVTISSPANGQVPVYNSSTGVWRNGRKIIFSTANPALNVGDELDMYVKLSSNDYGKSFRIYTTNTSSDWAAIAVETIISGTVTNTDYISYKSPSRTYSDFNTTYSSGNWRVNITTNNVDGRTQGEQIAWAYYSSQNLSLVISPPVVYGIYIKSNGVWVSCKDVPINAFADLTDVAFSNLQNGQVAIYNSTTGKWENGNIPSANDGTLTIQKNGVDVQTFTANQSTNVTANITVPTTAADVGAIATTAKGVASGVAELDANGKVPSSQLPSYVDDTIEGYLYNGHWYSDAQHTQEVSGETGKIYVELSTDKTYRWSGTTFVEISESLALGETSSTAYRGDRGATAYSHATDANKVSSATATGLYKIGATAEGHISELQAVQKSDITNLGIPGSVPDIVDNLNSTDATKTLSAKQGKVLKDAIDEKSSVFTLTITQDETYPYDWHCDKTPNEVINAYNAQNIIQIIADWGASPDYNGSDSYNLTYYSLEDSTLELHFSNCDINSDDTSVFYSSEVNMTSFKLVSDDLSSWDINTCFSNIVGVEAEIYEDDNVYYCDVTPEDLIYANSSINGRVIVTDDDGTYTFSKYDNGTYYFTSSNVNSSNELSIKTYAMTPNNDNSDWASIVKYETNGSGDIIWTGTQAEYEAQASQIPVGAYVNITDDEQIIPYASAIRWEEARTSVKKNLLNALYDSWTFDASQQQSKTMGTVYLNVGDKIIYSANQTTTLTSITRNTLQIINPNNVSTYESTNADYHLNSGVHTMTFTATIAGEHAFSIWSHTPDVDNTYNQFMVRLESIADDTYVPYIPDNTELVRYTDNAVLGVKNLLPMPYKRFYNGSSFGGVTVNIANDYSFTLSGTHTDANEDIPLTDSIWHQTNVPDFIPYILPAGDYIFSTGVLSTQEYSNLRYEIHNYTSGSYTKVCSIASGSVNFTLTVDSKLYVRIRFAGAVTISNPITVKPMLRLASDTDTTYQPYAMTNRQLTEEVQKTVWSSSVSALTGATSVTITDANIHTSSVIEPFADNGTNTAMSMPTMTVTEGQCVLGFDALTADTTFKLRITN